MRRANCFSCLLALVFGTLVFVESAPGTHPVRQRSYEFLPRLSTLHQSGGIAGLDERFTIHGPFDFASELNHSILPGPDARFLNVEAWASHPILRYILPIDKTLQLSQLKGKQIFSGPHGLEVFRFRGEEGQGAPMKLHVATLGRWMYMRGQNDPPCCDFFNYEIRALARQDRWSDFDESGMVGADDLQRWEESFGTSQRLAEEADMLSGHDFLRWQRQFGEHEPSLTEFDAMIDTAIVAANSTTLTNVPEPTSSVLLAISSVFLTGRRWRRC